jgi:cob(I)alamin adenosyltransferase
MNEQERLEAAQQCQQRFQEATELAAADGGLLILDEVCAAITAGFLPLTQVLTFLDTCPEGLEVVLTGRDPDPSLLERADYVTVMRKEKHPYDQGITARRGIEY